MCTIGILFSPQKPSIMNKHRYRIIRADGRIKFAGTDNPSWFNDLEKARKLCDTTKNESIYEYDYEGRQLWEVL